MIPLGATIVGIIYVFCLVRDLPRKLALQMGAYATLFVGANGILGVLAHGSHMFEIAIMCMLGAFIVVTGGHVIRAWESDLFGLPPDVARKYNRHPGRYQLGGIALGLTSATIILGLLGYL